VVQPSIGRADLAPILVVGAASRDLDPTDPHGWRLGGTVSYASLTLARLGVPTRALIGVDREAADAADIAVLRDAGVDVKLVPLAHGPVFDNRETPAGRVQIAHEVSDTLQPGSLPAEWRNSPTVLLGPVAGEIGDEWAAAVEKGAFVALAWQGLLRRLKRDEQVERLEPRPSALVERASAVFVSAEDVRGSDARLVDLVRADQRLFVTGGANGALMLQERRGRRLPALPERQVVDSTGAGDVFMAAWLAARTIAPEAGEWRHLAVASAMASLSTQARRLLELPGRRELCEVLVRLRDRRLG
jgi:sugar/nucleoside kinase (ribokinase family)